jgi:hypothetical protein
VGARSFRVEILRDAFDARKDRRMNWRPADLLERRDGHVNTSTVKVAEEDHGTFQRFQDTQIRVDVAGFDMEVVPNTLSGAPEKHG